MQRVARGRRDERGGQPVERGGDALVGLRVRDARREAREAEAQEGSERAVVQRGRGDAPWPRLQYDSYELLETHRTEGVGGGQHRISFEIK